MVPTARVALRSTGPAVVLLLAMLAAACTGPDVVTSPVATGTPEPRTADPATDPTTRLATSAPTDPGRSGTPTETPLASPTERLSNAFADLVLRNGNVLTLDDARPAASAVAIKGQLVAGVGAENDVSQWVGPLTTVVDLEGRTVTPGFADAHQHRIGDGPSVLGVDAATIVEATVAQGLTTIDELYVDQPRLDELIQMDDAGSLPLFVNAYLPVNENSAAGSVFDPYWNAYQPGEYVSPHVRVAGLKVFTDFDNAQILLWEQSDLADFLRDRHAEGWPLAVKTVSTTSLDMIIGAINAIAVDDPGILDARVRLEHNIFATPQQIEALARLGMVPAINLNVPGQLVDEPDIEALIAREPADSYAPWRRMFDAGLRATGISGFPSFYVDEPSGAPFGSPIHLIYQAVTRVGNLGQESPPELLDQAISAEEAFRSLTINAAYAAFEDDVTGSIEVGKRADLAVLDEDPLAVEPATINDIGVALTVVAGDVQCLVPIDNLCPKPPPSEPGSTGTPTAPPGPGATASAALAGSPAANAFDGNPDTAWNAGAHPEQWLQVDLGETGTLGTITLTVAQDPAGSTSHEIWVGPSQDALQLAHAFNGDTQDGQVLTYSPEEPLVDVRIVRIVTTSSPSWVAWREVALE